MAETIEVVSIITETDMRGVHKVRASVRCKAGEGRLFINKRLTIARLIDAARAVHTYYAPMDEKFNVALLQGMMLAFRLRLSLPSNADDAFQRPRIIRRRRLASTRSR